MNMTRIIAILAICFSCGIPQRQKWHREFTDAVDNQFRCNEPFWDAVNTEDFQKMRLYCDSISYYANIVDSTYNLMYPVETTSQKQ